MSDGRADLKSRAENGRCSVLLRHVRRHARESLRQVGADQAFDVMMDGGAGFAGFAAGPMGQSPGRSRHDRRAGSGLIRPGALEP